MSHCIRVCQVTYWNWVADGRVWGLRADGLALADLTLFDEGVGVTMVIVCPVTIEGKPYFEITRGPEYDHRLWQPRDFMQGVWG